MALSAVAITDEMLATMKRLPIGYTKEDSPTSVSYTHLDVYKRQVKVNDLLAGLADDDEDE